MYFQFCLKATFKKIKMALHLSYNSSIPHPVKEQQNCKRHISSKEKERYLVSSALHICLYKIKITSNLHLPFHSFK